MRYEHRTLPVPASVAAGDPVNTTDLREMVLQVSGTFDAELTVFGQAQPLGPWTPFGDPIAGPGWHRIEVDGRPVPLHALRVDVTAYESGAPVVVLGGLNHRVE